MPKLTITIRKVAKVVGVTLLVALAATLLWLIYALHWAFTAVPGGGDAAARQVDTLIARYQPADDNGAAGYEALRDAFLLYQEEDTAFRSDYASIPPPASWPSDCGYPYDWYALQRTHAENIASTQTRLFFDRLQGGGLPAALATVAGHPAFARPASAELGSNPLYNFPCPLITSSFSITRYSSSRMWLATASGDEAELVAAFEGALAVPRAFASADPLGASRSIAHAANASALYTLRLALHDNRLKSETLHLLVDTLDRQSVWPSIEFAIEGARIEAQDSIERMYGDDGDGNGRFLANEFDDRSMTEWANAENLPNFLRSDRLSNLLGFILPSKREALAFCNAHFDKIVTASKEPDWSAQVAATPDLNDADKFRHPVPGMMVRWPPFLFSFDPALQSQITGTRLMLAIEQFRAARGHCPNSLDQLVPQFLKSVPTDPFTGTPYGYIKFERPDNAHRDYLLYSYGSNFLDDGGAYTAEYNLLTTSGLPVTSKLDFILNEVPEPTKSDR